jgi:hypothetical protein
MVMTKPTIVMWVTAFPLLRPLLCLMAALVLALNDQVRVLLVKRAAAIRQIPFGRAAEWGAVAADAVRRAADLSVAGGEEIENRGTAPAQPPSRERGTAPILKLCSDQSLAAL